MSSACPNKVLGSPARDKLCSVTSGQSDWVAGTSRSATRPSSLYRLAWPGSESNRDPCRSSSRMLRHPAGHPISGWSGKENGFRFSFPLIRERQHISIVKFLARRDVVRFRDLASASGLDGKIDSVQPKCMGAWIRCLVRQCGLRRDAAGSGVPVGSASGTEPIG
jgi:hypothetical protein